MLKCGIYVLISDTLSSVYCFVCRLIVNWVLLHNQDPHESSKWKYLFAERVRIRCIV